MKPVISANRICYSIALSELITNGISEYLIHDKKQYIRQSDLLFQ